MKGLKGKVVIVAGAGSGIGQAASVRLVEEGSTVLCVDVSQQSLDETLSIIGDGAKTRCLETNR